MLKRILLLFLIWSTSSAQAGLMSIDWRNTGDGLITRAGGLEYLDLSQTRNKSILEILMQMSVGGYYETWHFAKHEQIIDLFFEAGAVRPSSGFQDDNWEPQNVAAARKLLDYWAGEQRVFAGGTIFATFGSTFDLDPNAPYWRLAAFCLTRSKRFYMRNPLTVFCLWSA